jgi:hypothetical protein
MHEARRLDMIGTNEAALPPEAIMIQMATGNVVSKLVYVATTLGIAEPKPDSGCRASCPPPRW